jgi:hypothetical protein
MLTMTQRMERFRAALLRRVPLADERDRLVAVVQDLVDWSTSRPDVFLPNENDHEQSVVSFRHRGSGRVAWSVYPRDKDGPKLEIFPRSLEVVPPGTVERARSQVAALSRDLLLDGGTLRVRLAALKSAPRREEMKQLILDLAAVVSNADDNHTT